MSPLIAVALFGCTLVAGAATGRWLERSNTMDRLMAQVGRFGRRA